MSQGEKRGSRSGSQINDVKIPVCFPVMSGQCSGVFIQNRRFWDMDTKYHAFPVAVFPAVYCGKDSHDAPICD